MSAPETTIVIDPGRQVICDTCSADMTDSPETGGGILAGWAYCPRCADGHKAELRRYKTAKWCPAGISFADWIRSVR